MISRLINGDTVILDGCRGSYRMDLFFHAEEALDKFETEGHKTSSSATGNQKLLQRRNKLFILEGKFGMLPMQATKALKALKPIKISEAFVLPNK